MSFQYHMNHSRLDSAASTSTGKRVSLILTISGSEIPLQKMVFSSLGYASAGSLQQCHLSRIFAADADGLVSRTSASSSIVFVLAPACRGLLMGGA